MLRTLTSITVLIITMLVGAAPASAAPAERAFALSGTNLLSFNPTNPSSTSALAITGVNAGETLVGIDVRPQNGVLYGIGVNATANTATLYAISTETGGVTAVGAASSIAFTTDGATPVDLPDPASVGYGFDFNPAADRIRVVAGSLNFRINPSTGGGVDGDNGGAIIAGTNPDGAINGGTTTADASAYTNNQPNNGSITTIYTLDASSDSLFIANPPNTGTQTVGQAVTLSGSPLNFTNVNGFDIPSGVNAGVSNAAVVSGVGYAVLNVGGTTGLYSINLVTAAATLLGNVGNGATAVQGLALQRDLDDAGFPAVALTFDGMNLLRFQTSTPGTLTTQVMNLAAVTASEVIVALAWRPTTGQLYALGVNATADTGSLYLVDPQTGVVSLAVGGTASMIAYSGVNLPSAAVAAYGMDFNPTADRIRVTTSAGLNARINPTNGLAVDSVPGGANDADGAQNGLSGGSTGVAGVSYTNAYAGATLTTAYTLDANANELMILNPPNNGTLGTHVPVTLGGTPLDFAALAAFDIPPSTMINVSGAQADGDGYATLAVGGVTGLFRIDLTTGTATSLGAVGAGATSIRSFAIGNAQRDLPKVSVVDATDVTEGNSGPTMQRFTLSLSSPAPFPMSVTATTADGTATVADSDFVTRTETISFVRGQRTATFDVDVNGDMKFEPRETYGVSLTLPSTLLRIDDAAATGGIANDDTATTTPPTENPPAATPVLSKFAFSTRTFRAASKGASLAAAKKRPVVRPIGAVVSFQLSTAATVKLTLAKAVKGRKSGSKCVAQRPSNASAKPCTRYVAVRGSISRVSVAGANKSRFTGRFNGKTLAPGKYRMQAVAVGAAAGTKPTYLTFTIVT